MIESRAPRYERELAAFLYKREAPTHEVDVTRQPPFDNVTGSCLDIGLSQLACEIVASRKKLAPLKHLDCVRAQANPITVDVGKILLDR